MYATNKAAMNIHDFNIKGCRSHKAYVRINEIVLVHWIWIETHFLQISSKTAKDLKGGGTLASIFFHQYLIISRGPHR